MRQLLPRTVSAPAVEGSDLNELQHKVRVFAVEFSGEALQTAAQPGLVLPHQVLTLFIQLHSNAKFTLPAENRTAEKELYNIAHLKRNF